MKDGAASGVSGPEELRRLLRRRAAEVAGDVAREGGPVPAEELERLERLARLAELCGSEEPRRRKRWPMAAVVGGTLVVVSLLLFTRVPETEVELDLELDEIEFSTPEPPPDSQELAGVVEAGTLGVSGVEEIRLPRSRDEPARTVQGPPGTTSAILLKPAPEAEEAAISLVGLTLPPGARVSLEPREAGRGIRLSLEGAAQELSVNVFGAIQVAVAPEGSRVLDFSTPRSIHLVRGAQPVHFDLVLPEGAPGSLARQLLVEDLSLHRVEEFALDSQGTEVWLASTVLGGTVYFESLRGESYSLRPRQVLRFDASRGEIRTLELADGHLRLRFHGQVEGMATGSREHARSLMPTTLEWIRARHGLSLFWGTTIYLTGIVLSLLRWWKGSL